MNKAEKMIITTEPIDIEIKKITLLSIGEYKECRDIVPLCSQWWWLRSPGAYHDDRVVSVYYDAEIYNTGCRVRSIDGAVRPALVYESNNLQKGDHIKLFDLSWTVVSSNMMLCDNIIGHTCFRKDWEADDASDYEKSDIKVWLENWFKNNITK